MLASDSLVARGRGDDGQAGCACVRGDWIDRIPIPPQQNTSLGQERELSTRREVAPPLILIYASL